MPAESLCRSFSTFLGEIMKKGVLIVCHFAFKTSVPSYFIRLVRLTASVLLRLDDFSLIPL